MKHSLPVRVRRNPTHAVLTLMFVGALVSGCQQAELRPDPAYAPLRPSTIAPTERYDGAIYKAGFGMRLFEDTRARHVGDILTVQLTEATNATTATSTTTSKESSVTAANPVLLGTAAQFNVPGALPLAATSDLNLQVTQESEQDFEGSGTSEQSNSLTGFVTVTVVEVLPNQNLLIRGEKLMQLNRGQEHVRLSGIVRPQDINGDNVVASNRIGNVSITYAGTGELAAQSSMGWLTRFFSSTLWPF
ncbi:MAG: flagellar basal body L-ring protein FlgH [Pseudomonadota bacterium]